MRIVLARMNNGKWRWSAAPGERLSSEWFGGGIYDRTTVESETPEGALMLARQWLEREKKL